MIIDTHAHLTKEVYKKELKDIINNMPNDNLEKIFVIGYDLKSSKACLKLAKKHKDIYAAIGIHPSYVKGKLKKSELKWLEKNATHEKVIAIGEIGLDFHWSTKYKQEQFDAFSLQIKLADKLNLPIIIHTRDASYDLIEFLNQHKSHLNNSGIVHCFSNDIEFFNKVKDLGLIISVGGVITYKNAVSLQDAVKEIPLSHIVLETDSPYLSPMPHRGKLNYPKNTNFVAKKLAEIKNISVQEIEEITNNNVYDLFKKLKK